MDAAEENRRLRRRLRYLIRNQAALETRLVQIENSVIFRFLRWIGDVLGMNRAAASGGQEYAAWIREAPATESGVEIRSPISLILMARDCVDLKRTISSIAAQNYRGWELYICGAAPSEPAAPGIKMVADIGAALDQITGPFVGIIGVGAILEPDAIRNWLAALESDERLTAVYSDWDLISREGRRHSPRFTPEFSLELLSAAAYWGCCFAARTEAVRKAAGNGDRDLSRRLAEQCLGEHFLGEHFLGEQGGGIARIPRILWHLDDTQAPALEPPQAHPSASGETASIIICSRNAQRLEACLTSLRPTVDARHRTIVVAHLAADQDSELARAAERHGAMSVPYQGAFHFGRMNALGASAARGSVLVLMNDDVRPVAPDWLESMVAQAARPEIGVVGALLLYPSGAIQHAGIVVGGTLIPAHAGRSQHESAYWPWLRMTREVSAVTGACLAIRRSVWDELGGFDYRFPVNFNDVDLCLRAQKHGLRVIVETHATLTHQEAATRVPSVRAEEIELFWELWGDVLSTPDAFFNPQLEIRDETIQLPRPWPRRR